MENPTKVIDTTPHLTHTTLQQKEELNCVGGIYIVGCGGVGSYLLPVLLRLSHKFQVTPTIYLVDGDRLETKNLDRQLFLDDQIGTNKAEALRELYAKQFPTVTIKAMPEYFYPGYEIEPNSIIFCCVDNMAGRAAVLQTIDMMRGTAILGGNEYTDSEAYIYESDWKDSPLDPRKYYPEILKDKANDPTAPASCQGQAAIASPQLVLANFSAANHMLQLFWFHFVSRKTMDKKESFGVWPTLHRNTFSRFSTVLADHRMGGERKA